MWKYLLNSQGNANSGGELLTFLDVLSILTFATTIVLITIEIVRHIKTRYKIAVILPGTPDWQYNVNCTFLNPLVEWSGNETSFVTEAIIDNKSDNPISINSVAMVSEDGKIIPYDFFAVPTPSDGKVAIRTGDGYDIWEYGKTIAAFPIYLLPYESKRVTLMFYGAVGGTIKEVDGFTKRDFTLIFTTPRGKTSISGTASVEALEGTDKIIGKHDNA